MRAKQIRSIAAHNRLDVLVDEGHSLKDILKDMVHYNISKEFITRIFNKRNDEYEERNKCKSEEYDM